MAVEWLVLGLGNPGREYERTRHNAGFWVAEKLRERHRLSDWKDKFGAAFARGMVSGQEVIVAMPMTYMNRSGEPGGSLAGFFKIAPARTIVVHDELDFEPGVVRVKVGGGAGGHNGLRSLTQAMGSEFVRVRMGVGKPPSSDEGAGFVLTAPRGDEKARLDEAVEMAADAVEEIVKIGVVYAMNKVNTKK